MTILGVDVSKYQAPAEWGKVYASGIRFAIARASIGTKPDYTFDGHVVNADRAGLIVGAYHYLYPRSWVSPEAQCDVFLSRMDGDPNGFICVVDVEFHGPLNGVQTKVDITDVRRFAARFRERAPGHTLIVYSGGWYWNGYMGNPKGSDIGPLWNSRYVTPRGYSPQTLYSYVPSSWWTTGYGGWSGPTILQFTSGARVPGFDELVDANAYRGTLASLKALTLALPESDTEDRMAVAQGTFSAANGLATAKVGATAREYLNTSNVIAYDEGDPRNVFSQFRSVGGGEYYCATLGDPDKIILLPKDQWDFVSATPVDTTPFDQEDIDTAAARAVAEDRAKARIVWD